MLIVFTRQNVHMVTFSQLGRYGRFGNQLFQIAGTIGIAEANGYDYGFPKWINHDAKERFNTEEDINVGEWFENPLPEFGGVLPDYFIHWGFHGLQHPDNVSYSGHLQSPRYFDHVADKIRHYFTLKEEYAKNEYTAIHIRMGDYGSEYHPILSDDYLRAATAYLGGPYLLFSDGGELAYQRLKALGIESELFVGNTRDSFRQMKACKNHIIANSTFSWWAAWLAGGQVVAPSKWFGAVAGLDAKDIYCENWKVI